ncbi:MAG: GNAT family N-acetyltransferase [Microbacteriaceae bacterium]
MLIDQLTTRLLPQALALNNANVPAVSVSDDAGIAALLELSEVALAVVDEAEPETLLGFALLMAPGSAYSSENYRWFDSHRTEFLYLDRIVVADSAQNQGVGRAIYDAVFEAARERNLIEVTCEVNVDPPNPGSLRFHDRLGFTEVGQLSTKGGSVVVSLLAAPVVA